MTNAAENSEFDKTIIESNLTQAQPQIPQQNSAGLTSSSARLDLGQTSTGNPYQKADILPTGQESIPLGSGMISGLLGAGGMARVYKIWNEKLEVYRAVKIIIPGHGSDLKNRFETEAKITAKLHHPNIVEIYSVGDWNGLPFLEMEYIDGSSLENLILKYGKLPDSVASAIGILIARALTYAHCQQFLLYGKNYNGVIHRDLKPANIMISGEGTVKLMDFGIARPTDASFHTVEGSVVGTLQYLAPEQLDGITIDARADLYAFGTILYEMLTGIKTFPQKTITNLMKTKAMNEYRRMEDFEFQVNPVLARIAQKCLQVNPETRFRDAKSLLLALDAAHKGLSSETPESVIKSYVADPVQFKTPQRRRAPNLFKPAVVIPVVSTLVLALVAAVVILTAPQGVEKPRTQQKDSTSAVAVVGPVDLTSDSVRPLAPPPQPVQEQVKPPTPSPAAVIDPKPAALAAKPQPPIKKVEPSPQPPAPEQQGDRLQQKYRSSDMMIVARSALSSGAYRDAIEALEKLPESHPDFGKKDILLLDASIQSNRLNDAMALVSGSSVDDAQFELLAGKLYLRRGELSRALEKCERAMLRPSSLRPRGEVINDALYYGAQVRTKIYEESPSPDKKTVAQQAWLRVKNIYSNAPESARYQEAMNALLSLR